MQTLDLDGRRFNVARANESDVPALAALLADDVLGGQRESTDLERYAVAFQEIDRDPNHLLVAVRDAEDNLVGTMQLTLIPGLARSGAKRLQIEGCALRPARAAPDWVQLCSSGLTSMANGATLAQLTTDKTRTDAHRFYDRLGYQATHEGYKRPL